MHRILRFLAPPYRSLYSPQAQWLPELTAEGNERFTVRFQTKAMQDDVVVWSDAEVSHEVGKSQRYGIDENFRLIVEAGSGSPS
jgi:hypothetical protein